MAMCRKLALWRLVAHALLCGVSLLANAVTRSTDKP